MTKLNDVVVVNYKILTDEFVGYEFQTEQEIYVTAGDYYTDLFRIELRKGGSYNIYTQDADSYDVSDDVTEYFDEEEISNILKACIYADAFEILEDHTAAYEGEKDPELNEEKVTQDYDGKNVYTHVGRKAARDIFRTRKPLGKFYTIDDGMYIGIDNSTGEAWIKEFKTQKECFAWLGDY